MEWLNQEPTSMWVCSSQNFLFSWTTKRAVARCKSRNKHPLSLLLSEDVYSYHLGYWASLVFIQGQDSLFFCVRKDTSVARARRWLEWDSEDLDDFLCDCRENTQPVSHKRQEPGNQDIFQQSFLIQLPTWTQRSSETLSLCLIY